MLDALSVLNETAVVHVVGVKKVRVERVVVLRLDLSPADD